MVLSMEELVGENDRLRDLIYTLDKLSQPDELLPGPEPFSVTSIGRRIAPSTIPPTFIRFNTESGPLEPLPQLFQVPFPTMENFKGSLLNSKLSANRLIAHAPRPSVVVKQQPALPIHETLTTPAPAANKTKSKELSDDEEYADDF